MSIKTKEELQATLVTGHTLVEQDFIDLTDSTVGVIQGTDGNLFNIRASNVAGEIVGNVRGEYSVDLQTYPVATNNTASGYGSVIAGGKGNTTYDQDGYRGVSEVSTLSSGTYSSYQAYNVVQSSTDGNGAGAEFTINTAGGGSIGSVAVTANGDGYRQGDVITISSSQLDNGGDATLQVTQLISVGRGDYASIGGGVDNRATGNCSVIAGGTLNVANAYSVSIGGGVCNISTGNCSVISGGEQNNIVNGHQSVISGGYLNNISGEFSVIAGGSNGCVSANSSVVSGGDQNQATALYTTVSGGYCNVASDGAASIVGGYSNTASADYATVAGGFCNVASGWGSFIAGGENNIASGNISVVGGSYNTASAACSGILGGAENIAANVASFVIGACITTNRDCTTFVNNLSIMNIPTSSAGLPSGSIWSDGGTLKIV